MYILFHIFYFKVHYLDLLFRALYFNVRYFRLFYSNIYHSDIFYGEGYCSNIFYGERNYVAAYIRKVSTILCGAYCTNHIARTILREPYCAAITDIKADIRRISVKYALYQVLITEIETDMYIISVIICHVICYITEKTEQNFDLSVI